jgi:transposase-like protein
MAKTVEAPVSETQDKQKPAGRSRAPRKAKMSKTKSKKTLARKGGAKARTPARRKTSAKRGPSKRYTAAEKARIMAAAKKGNLTGAQAAKKFGISMLTFYRWRGPVRGGKKRGRPVGSKNRVAASSWKVDLAKVRQEVQAQIRKMLPRMRNYREDVVSSKI